MTSRGDRYPNSVPPDERPDFTVENIPDDVLWHVIGIATRYQECPECGTRQFIPFVPNMNSRQDCRECNFEMVIVG